MKRLTELTLIAIITVSVYHIGVFVYNKYILQVPKALIPYKAVSTNEKNRYAATIRLKDSMDQFYCSGVVIDGNYAMTAAHCVTNSFGLMRSDPIRIYDVTDNFTGTIAKVVALEPQRDIAFIQGNFEDFTYVNVDFSGQYINAKMPAMSCGFPAGQRDLYCVMLELEGNRYFQYKFKGNTIFPGMSGGPVIGAGLVIGINSAVYDNGVIVAPVVGALESVGL